MQHRDFMPVDGQKAMDAGTYTAAAAAQVGGSDKIFTFGDPGIPANQRPKQRGTVFIRCTDVDVANNDHLYRFAWQVSNSATFASGIVTVTMAELGHATAILGDTSSPDDAEIVLPVMNYINGNVYLYGRLYRHQEGTADTITTLDAWFTRDAGV